MIRKPPRDEAIGLGVISERMRSAAITWPDRNSGCKLRLPLANHPGWPLFKHPQTSTSPGARTGKRLGDDLTGYSGLPDAIDSSPSCWTWLPPWQQSHVTSPNPLRFKTLRLPVLLDQPKQTILQIVSVRDRLSSWLFPSSRRVPRDYCIVKAQVDEKRQ